MTTLTAAVCWIQPDVFDCFIARTKKKVYLSQQDVNYVIDYRCDFVCLLDVAELLPEISMCWLAKL